MTTTVYYPSFAAVVAKKLLGSPRSNQPVVEGAPPMPMQVANWVTPLTRAEKIF